MIRAASSLRPIAFAARAAAYFPALVCGARPAKNSATVAGASGCAASSASCRSRIQSRLGQVGWASRKAPSAAKDGRGSARRDGPFQRRSPGLVVRRLGERRQARSVALVVQDHGLRTARRRRRQGRPGRCRRGRGRRDRRERADHGRGARDVGVSELGREVPTASRSLLGQRRGVGASFGADAASRAEADRARRDRAVQGFVGRRGADGGERSGGRGSGADRCARSRRSAARRRRLHAGATGAPTRAPSGPTALWSNAATSAGGRRPPGLNAIRQAAPHMPRKRRG